MLLLYCPCPTVVCARDIAGRLLNDKIIACANIVPAVVSVYEWEGTVVEEAEVLLLAKLPADHRSQVQKVIEAMHPYEVPAILFLDVKDTNPAFAGWVQTVCCR